MRFHFIHILRFQQPPQQTQNQQPQVNDDDTYIKEHERLEAIVSDSEDIWEERTYQIAAGGLSITFTIFCYMANKNISFDWQMILIWGLYAAALLLNYISHRVPVNDARKMQAFLKQCRESGEPYNETALNEKYKKQGRLLTVINWIVGLTLVGAVIYTIIYTCIHLMPL